MAQKQQLLEVSAEFRQVGGEFVVTAPEHGVTGKGITKVRAGLNLRDKLQEKLKREVVLVQTYTLSSPLRKRLDEFRRNLELETKLKEKREIDQVFLAKDLIIETGMEQQHAAKLLSLSPTWLAQLLKKESTGEIKKPSDK